MPPLNWQNHADGYYFAAVGISTDNSFHFIMTMR